MLELVERPGVPRGSRPTAVFSSSSFSRSFEFEKTTCPGGTAMRSPCVAEAPAGTGGTADAVRGCNARSPTCSQRDVSCQMSGTLSLSLPPSLSLSLTHTHTHAHSLMGRQGSNGSLLTSQQKPVAAAARPIGGRDTSRGHEGTKCSSCAPSPSSFTRRRRQRRHEQ